MSSTSLSPYDADRLRKWRVAHILASFIAVFIALALFANFTSLNVESPLLNVVAMPVVISFYWLWIWMIHDLYANGVPTNKTAWWFILIGLLFFGVLLYFFSVWRPRNRPFDD